MLDDAHGVSIELLRHIGVLADSGGGERLLQVILVGQPPLVNTLTKTSLRPIFQQAATHATLAPLEEEEVEEYVRHRLNVGGRNARVQFNRDAIAELQTLSQGVPRVINLICDQALLEGSQQSAGEIDAQLVRRAAEHVDLVPRQAGAVASARRFVGLMILFAVLMIVGAAAGAFFYRSEIGALIQRWQERPAAPAPPPLAAPSIPAPLARD
jgi:general secretion pathway protein A